jgi:hypothetical protein
MLSEKSNVERLNGVKQEDVFIYVGDFMGKPRMVKSDRWRKRGCVLRYWQIKDELNRQLGDFKLGNCFYVQFQIKMPDSWSKKKKEKMLGKPHQNKPDNSNLVKSLEDMILEDDSCVWFTISNKVWGNETRVIVKNIDDEKLKKIQEMFE